MKAWVHPFTMWARVLVVTAPHHGISSTLNKSTVYCLGKWEPQGHPAQNSEYLVTIEEQPPINRLVFVRGHGKTQELVLVADVLAFLYPNQHLALSCTPDFCYHPGWSSSSRSQLTSASPNTVRSSRRSDFFQKQSRTICCFFTVLKNIVRILMVGYKCFLKWSTGPSQFHLSTPASFIWCRTSLLCIPTQSIPDLAWPTHASLIHSPIIHHATLPYILYLAYSSVLIFLY